MSLSSFYPACHIKSAIVQALGSLVLGGFDEARIQPNTTAKFGMPVGSDETELALTVQKIAVVGTNGNSSIYEDAFDAILESAVPYLFLPLMLCNWFENLFNLTYDAYRDIYTIDPTVADANYNKIQSITFGLGNQTGQTMTNISFNDYRAFSPLASWTWNLDSGQRIFPIKRMPNNSKTAVLGRAFFQEAYVSVHYPYNGSGTFTVSQVAYPTPETTRIIPIVDGARSSNPIGLSTGKIAAIAVGAFVGVVLIFLLYWFFFLRKRIVRKKKEIQSLEMPNRADEAAERPPVDRCYTASSIVSDRTIAASEVDGTSRPRHSRQPSELSADSEVQRAENKLGPLHEEPDKSDAAQLERYAAMARERQGQRQEMEASSDWFHPDPPNARTPTSPSELYSTPELPASPVSPDLMSTHS
ncbi:uncharacterized protein PV09_05036 [Verruconis gallopava]|uniref:Peptidase A1 domain-containing protein n=1 Tax=Verruconis gallopava TaxID=253628 RepID=A0A0D1YSV9_9PEZI|nr:uncharacterized protein PV09_05036 [Verruconis gallopava]KIW03727.1 hypothetical protein PV09_05036 [Verruconis gallopava]